MMGRPRRTITPLDADKTDTHTEAEATPVLALVPEPEPDAPPVSERTPARQKLADAIATVAALERAKPRPVGSYFKPREPHTFRSQEEADAYDVLMNTPPPSIEDAKAAVATATDARDSAVAAVQFHKRRLEAASNRLQWNRSNIDAAARLVVHFDPAMAALAAEVKSLATRAAAAERAFSLATGGVLLQPSNPHYGCTSPTDFRTDPKGWAVVHRWREALEQLATDPDAPLPMPASV